MSSVFEQSTHSWRARKTNMVLVCVLCSNVAREKEKACTWKGVLCYI